MSTSARLCSRLCLLSCGLLVASSTGLGCAHRAGPGADGAYSSANAAEQDEDLGDPRDSLPPREDPSMEEILAAENTSVMTFDGNEPNSGPTDMVQSPPKRPKMPSMLPSVLTGPSGAAPAQ